MRMFLARAAVLTTVLVAPSSCLSFDQKLKSLDEKKRPVGKVIDLLQGMQDQLEKEADEDRKLNNKMECWCNANKDEMRKTIADSNEAIATNKAIVEEQTANGERLGQEIRSLGKEKQFNQDTLNTGHALRAQQREKSSSDIQTLQDNIDAVSKAELIIGGEFLQKRKGSELLQSESTLKSVVASLKRIAHKNKDMITRISTRADRYELDEFINDPKKFLDERKGRKTAFLQGDGGGASSAIDGLLNDMKDDFTRDLEDEKKEDEINEKHYQELVSAKTEEIAAQQAAIEKKTAEKAEAAKKVADAKEAIMAAEDALADATAYLATVTDKCAVSAEEYQGRYKVRTEETMAVGKALQILDSDEAHALTGRSLSFLQESSSVSALESRRKRAVRALRSADMSTNAQKLANLVVDAKGAGFEKVKAEMEKMTAALKQEMKDEIAKRDQCTDDLNKNELSKEQKERIKESLTAKIGELRGNIQQVAEEMEAVKAAIAGLEKDKAAAQANRDQENQDFQVFVEDQRQTQVLLKRALEVLDSFYNFAQVGEHHADVPAKKTYKKNSGGMGVTILLQQIVEDSARMESDAKAAEQDALDAFNAETDKLNTAIKNKQVDLANKASKNANFETELAQTMQSKQGTLDDIDQLAQTNFALHQDCDFLLKNFLLRQKARTEELEAIGEAKAILGGTAHA